MSGDHPLHRCAPGVARGPIACVIDAEQQPDYDLEVFRWYASLTELCGVEPADLRVQVVGSAHSRVLDRLRERGVVVTEIGRFDARHPPCNKVGGALALAADAPGELCVLTDSDVVFFEDPRSIPLAPGHVGMRPVDIERPALEVLRAIFAVAGVAPPAEVPVGWENGLTLAGNGNGGFYLIPSELLGRVAAGWARWSTWLLDRDLLPRRGPRVLCVDQVAMALALAAESISVAEVDRRWNLPTHIALLGAPLPAMIHYHREVSGDGRILPTGVAAVDERIAQANALTAETWRATFGGRATTLASARELIATPELLRRYCHVVGPEAEATLAILAEDDDLAATFERLSASLTGIGIDPDDCPDMVIVPFRSDLSALAARAVLTGDEGPLRALALPRWSAAVATAPPGAGSG